MLSWKTWGILIGLVAFGAIGWAVWSSRGEDGPATQPTVRLPGDFEPTGALLLACHEPTPQSALSTIAQVVRAAAGKVPIVLLVSNRSEQLQVESLLQQLEVDTDQVRILSAPHNSPRIGHYGPTWIVRRDGGPALVDTLQHSTQPLGSKQAIPALAERFKLPIVRASLYVGGSLLTNGLGLALTTITLLDQNADLGMDHKAIEDMFRRTYGITQTVFLEPLEGEPTGDVRMFAAFTGPDTVVVGSYDERHDPVNAAVLDRNAQRLAAVELVADKKLKVVRIPMPPRQPGVWRSATTVVFANKVLLMPAYPGVDPGAQQEAQAIYEKLLPGWQVVPINLPVAGGHPGALRSLALPLGRVK